MFTATGDWATILPVSAVRTHAATGALQVNKISNPTVTRELSMIRRTTTAAWLARRHAITVLPAVSSLKALRRVGRPSAATKPMIGFGNPLLDGDPAERPWEVQWAKLAREKQVCPQTPWQRIAGLVEKRRSAQTVAIRGDRADLDHLHADPFARHGR